MPRRIRFAALILLALTVMPAIAGAAGPAPAQVAEQIRANLTSAQLRLAGDPTPARDLLATAHNAYDSALRATLVRAAPTAAERVSDGFIAADQALSANDSVGFAIARGQVWTALLDGSYRVVERALLDGDAATAQTWLPLREFRRATRFTRASADATLAIDGAVAGRLAPADALPAMCADLLDTYQARMDEALHDAESADGQAFTMRRAEAAALARGYFAILAPAYREQRGASALADMERAFADLESAARGSGRLTDALARVTAQLRGFRAAPLSSSEQIRRAGQMLRFLSLVPVEYERGVSGGTVTRDLEVREAITFRDGLRRSPAGARRARPGAGRPGRRAVCDVGPPARRRRRAQ